MTYPRQVAQAIYDLFMDGFINYDDAFRMADALGDIEGMDEIFADWSAKRNAKKDATSAK